MIRRIGIVEGRWSPGTAVADFIEHVPDAGGLATFIGKVRPDEAVRALELTHYARLTLRGMETLADEAAARWPLDGLLMLHRVGVLYPGEPIVCVSAAARHRRAAFEAVDFAMDHLKADAWFWKREQRGDGWHWIEPRGEDHADLTRWQATRPPG